MNTYFSRIKPLVIFISLAVLLLNTKAALSLEDPIAMLKKVTEKVTTELQNDPDAPTRVMSETILPHIDFVEMGRWIAGRNAWHDASNEVQEQFIQEFKTFLVKNYTQFLSKFSNHEIDFFPLREAIGKQRYIKVASQVIRDGMRPLSIDYHLILEADLWKVFDIIIDDVSILETYQAQFSDAIQQGGLAAAIEKIHLYNSNH